MNINLPETQSPDPEPIALYVCLESKVVIHKFEPAKRYQALTDTQRLIMSQAKQPVGSVRSQSYLAPVGRILLHKCC